YFYLRTEKMPLYEKGKIVGVLGVAIDITELKETQEKLKKAEGRIDGMTLLISSIAHELRTPLGAIKMTAFALGKYLPILVAAYKNVRKKNDPDYIPDENLESISNSIDRIQKSANNSNQIISMILTNLMAEETPVSKANLCSISDCINTSINEYAYPLGDKSMIDISGLKDFDFHGDKNLIKHVFFNLMKNAFYFIGKAGKGGISIWTEERNDYNQVYFKDTGYGILKGKLPKIFDKFYSSDTHHGTG